MEIRKEIAGVLKYFSEEALTTDEAIDSILLLFGVSPRIILFQKWEEDDKNRMVNLGLGIRKRKHQLTTKIKQR